MLANSTFAADSDSVLELSRLSKTFRVGFWARQVPAVRDVSLVMRRGESLGYLGPNGSGKTTSIKCLLALIAPSSGTARIFGRPTSDPLARARIGYLPESPYFYDYLTPSEVLDYVGKLYGLDAATRKQRSRLLLGLVGLDHDAKRPLRGFSKGMLQRVGIAQSLVADPDLLIWDEPLSGLDPMGRKEIRELMAELRRQGKSLFFSSHVLTDIESLCDAVCILDRGEAVAQGKLIELLAKDALESEAVLDLPTDPAPAIAALQAIASALVTTTASGLRVVLPTASIGHLCKITLDNQLALREISPRRDSLEELFLRKALATRVDGPGTGGAA